MDIDAKEFVWAEKYRPQSMASIVLPREIKSLLQEFVRQKNVPHLLFSGTAGIGKTTAAKALIADIGADMLYVNASLERGIDVIRNKIHQFVSTISLTGSRKIVLLDEADGLTKDGQDALRGFIEQFSHNAGFILTANHPSRLIPAILSRFTPVEFRVPRGETVALIKDFLELAEEILDNEGVEYDRKVLGMLIHKHFPDWRSVLTHLQKYSSSSKRIDSGVLVELDEAAIASLVGFMKKKEFSNVRKWVGENTDLPSHLIFRRFYDKAPDLFKPAFLPALVIILADYSDKASRAVDWEINVAACLASIMIEGQEYWKE